MLSTIILCATLMVLWGATMLVWLLNDKPLVSVTVINSPEPTRLILKQSARQVFA